MWIDCHSATSQPRFAKHVTHLTYRILRCLSGFEKRKMNGSMYMSLNMLQHSGDSRARCRKIAWCIMWNWTELALGYDSDGSQSIQNPHWSCCIWMIRRNHCNLNESQNGEPTDENGANSDNYRENADSDIASQNTEISATKSSPEDSFGRTKRSKLSLRIRQASPAISTLAPALEPWEQAMKDVRIEKGYVSQPHSWIVGGKDRCPSRLENNTQLADDMSNSRANHRKCKSHWNHDW